MPRYKRGNPLARRNDLLDTLLVDDKEVGKNLFSWYNLKGNEFHGIDTRNHILE